MRRRFGVIIGLVAVLALGACADDEETIVEEADSSVPSSSEGDPATESTTAATAAAAQETETVEPITGLPLLSGGPLLVGDQDTQESVAGTSVPSWKAAVERMRAEEPWYAACTDARIGVSLADAETYAALEPTYDLRFILLIGNPVSASGTPISDDEARAALEADGFENVDELTVQRVPMIRNTRRSHVGGEDRCQPFLDERPQVRISLGEPILDENDRKVVIGLVKGRGLLGHCGNPWDTETPDQPGTPSTTIGGPTTVPTVTVVTTPPGQPPITVVVTTTTSTPAATTTTTPAATTTTSAHPEAAAPLPVANQPPHQPPPTVATTAATATSAATSGTTPACGQAGQPSCDSTGGSPPAAVAPPDPPPAGQPPQDGTIAGP